MICRQAGRGVGGAAGADSEGDESTGNDEGRVTSFATGRVAASRWSPFFLRWLTLWLLGTVAGGATAIGRVIGDYGPPYTFAAFAGSQTWGWADGRGAAARFRGPSGVAVDRDGNVYVADSQNHLIRRITPSGVTTTLAGQPWQIFGVWVLGPRDERWFTNPTDVAVDVDGFVYVADSGDNVIRRITPEGVVTTLAGTFGVSGLTDGLGSAARFSVPRRIAVDANRNVYVVEEGNHTVRRITPGGRVLTLSRPSTDGQLTDKRIERPQGVTVDATGNLYVSEYGKIWKMGADTVWHRVGAADGAKPNDELGGLDGLTVDAAGQLFAVSQEQVIWKVGKDGKFVRFAGTPKAVGWTDGIGAKARFNGLGGIAVAPSGVLYATDYNTGVIRKVTAAAAVTTFVGAGFYQKEPGMAARDGAGAQARFGLPAGLAVDAAGTVYLADAGNHTIRKITSRAVVSTLAGKAQQSGSVDGIGAAARFNNPHGVAVDALRNVYVADTDNCTIRKIAPDGEVTTLAGAAGVRGSVDGNGTAARFNFPRGIAASPEGTIYVADTGNNTIRKITPAGVVTTLAGFAGGQGMADGVGTRAFFTRPEALTLDSLGDLLVVDTGSRRVRRVSPKGVVTTVAGVKDGISLAEPAGIACDDAHNLYVTDRARHTVVFMKVGNYSEYWTIAGISYMAGAKEGAGRQALFSSPSGIAAGPGGEVYVANEGDGLVRVGHPSGVPKYEGFKKIRFPLVPLQSIQWQPEFDGDPIQFSASGMPGSMHFGDGAGVVSGGVDRAGSFSAKLSVTNWSGTGNATIAMVVDQPPKISKIASRTIVEDASTLKIPFTVSDPDSPMAELSAMASAGSPKLVPTANLRVTGTGATRTLLLKPGINASGTTSVTVTVRDRMLSASTSFTLTVKPVNDRPTITAIANQTAAVNTPTKAIGFKIADIETAATQLKLTKTSSNSKLLPVANIVLGGTGTNRTVTLKPAAGQTGTTTVTLTVSDGQLSASRSFTLTVKATAQGTSAAPGARSVGATSSGGELPANLKTSPAESVERTGGTPVDTTTSAPTITTPPESQVVKAGEAVTLSVGARGATAYQWAHDEKSVAGATSSTLTLSAVQLTDAGGYAVTATNAAGTVTSRTAKLTVVDAAVASTRHGAILALTQTVTVAGAADGLTLSLPLPTGWSYLSGATAGAKTSPVAGATSLLEWTWTKVPGQPLTFTYVLDVPANQAVPASLDALITVEQDGLAAKLLFEETPGAK